MILCGWAYGPFIRSPYVQYYMNKNKKEAMRLAKEKAEKIK